MGHSAEQDQFKYPVDEFQSGPPQEVGPARSCLDVGEYNRATAAASHRCTEMRFASFLSGGFTTYGSNKSTRKETGKSTSVRWWWSTKFKTPQGLKVPRCFQCLITIFGQERTNSEILEALVALQGNRELKNQCCTVCLFSFFTKVKILLKKSWSVENKHCY